MLKTYPLPIFSLFLFVLFLSPTFSFGNFYQENGNKADSLLYRYQSTNSDREKLDLLSELVKVIHYSDSAQKYYPEAIRLANKLQDHDLEAQNLNRLGVYYRNMNLQEEALKLYEEALEISKKNKNPVQIGHSLNNIGQIYFFRDMHEESLEHYKAAETNFLKVGNKEGLAYNYTGMSPVLGALGRNKEALEVINKAIDIREEQGNERQLLVSKFNRSVLLMSMKEFDNVEEDIMNLYHYGITYDKIRAIHALEKLIELNLAKGNASKAISLAEEAKVLHEERPNSESMIEIFGMMYQLFFDRGNTAESKKYLSLLDQEKDILSAEKIKNYLAGLTIKKQKDEIAALSRENELMQANQKFKLYITFALLMLAFSLFVALSIYYRSYKKEIYNIGRLKEKQQQIESQAKELNILNIEKDKIFSILAHDLKAPLDSLWGMVKLMNEDNLNQEEFESYLPILSQNLGNNSMLLENILIWSRSQMRGMNSQFSRFNLYKLIEQNIAFLHGSGFFKGQVLENYIPKSIEIEADKTMLEIVIRNLLTNALKFTDELDKVTITIEEEERFYTVSVSDQGVGMTEAGLSRLFGSDFYSTTGTQQEKGTGLGLLLSKELVKKNRGEIWAKSQIGSGSTFCFTLPKF
ncbi:tetratricopeptide repeat-containing sensor histidine kinase [Aquiflexum sp. TKW24L]|uniref:tetratricopeptide repeat-containing sensor histidine kinase n=1 Tax=Aquiflexum sp. TKW24L TaxID=2942212 RepID=UPI0020BDB5DC|nr:tetratricopeptide repeat-containing sensor histidine kinase [Aquiflexum sp. TKW24L]MCL6258190.1 tetratricopeptide repeat-containing sensor histidine kinase [Aquiflexum sp. TKW24L]